MIKKKIKTGRPPKYADKEQMQIKIDAYFASCFSPRTTKDGKIVYDDLGNKVLDQVRPYTMSGLADALDLSRQGLIDYQGKPEFFDAIMRARRKCEVYTEERLFDRDGWQGAKFSLINNFAGWHDKSEVDHGLAESLLDKFSPLPVAELIKRANAIIGQP